MKTTTLLCFSLLLCACVTPELKPEPPTPPKAKAMQVWSYPLGCLVELDGDTLGITPCWVLIPENGSGEFRGPNLSVMKVFPLVGPAVPDVKLWWPGQRIPSISTFRPVGAQQQPWAPRRVTIR